jgi:hypothetical protein
MEIFSVQQKLRDIAGCAKQTAITTWMMFALSKQFRECHCVAWVNGFQLGATTPMVSRLTSNER